MTDTAPDPTSPGWTDQLGKLALDLVQAQTTYKVALLNAKSKAVTDATGKSSATGNSDLSPPFDFAKYAPWVAGGLLVLAVFVAVSRK